MSAQGIGVLTAFLTKCGITHPVRVAQITEGFDRNRPIYETTLWPGDRIFQYRRRESVADGLPATGNWFCLKGASMDGLAIFSGSGRNLVEFAVEAPIEAVEGTAAPMARNWGWAGGGAGG